MWPKHKDTATIGNSSIINGRLLAEMVKCAECKHYLSRDDAQKVSMSMPFGSDDFFYCPADRKPYSRMLGRTVGTPGNFETKFEYYAEVQMSEDGTPVEYKKIKPE